MYYISRNEMVCFYDSSSIIVMDEVPCYPSEKFSVESPNSEKSNYRAVTSEQHFLISHILVLRFMYVDVVHFFVGAFIKA